MNENLSECLKVALIAVIPALLALIASAFGWLRAWIEAKTRNEWFLVIEREAFRIVGAMGQKLVVPIKEAAADGKLTAEEADSIKQRAKLALIEALKDVPKHLMPDLETVIESAVSQTKGTGLSVLGGKIDQLLPLPSSPVQPSASGQK